MSSSSAPWPLVLVLVLIILNLLLINFGQRKENQMTVTDELVEAVAKAEWEHIYLQPWESVETSGESVAAWKRENRRADVRRILGYAQSFVERPR